jgi:glycine oxidase
MSDCLIIGGGVVGLSLAYELSGHGAGVRVLDASEPGSEASWAGAGILPPAPVDSYDPLQQLFALSNVQHRLWAEVLRASTGIDNGYRRCGGLYVAHGELERQELQQSAHAWQELGIAVHPVEPNQLRDIEPEVAAGEADAAWLLPDECQLRNPRHLKALLVACQRRGVEIVAGAAAEEFELRRERIVSVRTPRGSYTANQFCVTTGAWTRSVLAQMGCTVAVKPIRGQIVLLCAARRVLSRILNDGPRYVVPRDDGRLLVGSTEEDVGFDRSNTASGIAGLLTFAKRWVPALAEVPFERAWSGFRPATTDGRPYLGRLPGIANGFVAAGHFRNGLQLSSGTAIVMRQLMLDERVQIDLSPFRVDRPSVER